MKASKILEDCNHPLEVEVTDKQIHIRSMHPKPTRRDRVLNRILNEEAGGVNDSVAPGIYYFYVEKLADDKIAMELTATLRK